MRVQARARAHAHTQQSHAHPQTRACARNALHPLRPGPTAPTLPHPHSASLNGQPVSNEWLSPGWTNYTLRLHYQVRFCTTLCRTAPRWGCRSRLDMHDRSAAKACAVVRVGGTACSMRCVFWFGGGRRRLRAKENGTPAVAGQRAARWPRLTGKTTWWITDPGARTVLQSTRHGIQAGQLAG